MNKVKAPRILVDRMQLLAWPRGQRLPEIPEFRVRRDRFVRPQTSVPTYRRVRDLQSPKTKSEINAQYWRARPWWPPVKLTIIAGPRRGLQRGELEAVAKAFKEVRLLLVELAFDFRLDSGIDREFVLQHGLFGRSLLVGGQFYNTLRYGSQTGPKLVRAYAKKETSSYRVEVELHGSWLRRFGIAAIQDLYKLPALLLPAHFRFVTVDWDRLAVHLSRKDLSAEQVLAECRRRANSFPRLACYLRDEVRLHNVHRFVVPLAINRAIREALEAWARQWGSRS